MSKLIKSLLLATGFFAISAASAQSDNNRQIVIEAADVTIRMTNNHPYAEFRPCESCISRLVALTPAAQIYLNGFKTDAGALIDGQKMQGTVFIQTKPIEQVRKIVAN